MSKRGGGGEQVPWRFINIIAKKWALLIISIIGHHEKIRFNDIMQRLDGIRPRSFTGVHDFPGQEISRSLIPFLLDKVPIHLFTNALPCILAPLHT